jgi:glycosyltransferase involved in cell wall biosynthesis
MISLVSILITVHKRIDFLSGAIDSALSQSFPDREIIVADDSGCSAAKDICKPYLEAGRIRYRANPQTLGIAMSLRTAIEGATGKYIAVLNDDDIWEPEFLAYLIPPLEADSRRVLAFSDHWIMAEDGTIDVSASDINTRHYGRYTLAEGEVINPAKFVLIQNGVPLAMASVFRKDTVNPRLLTPDVAGAYDFWISCVLAASGGTFYYVPRRLTCYRVHSRMETGRRSPDKSENQVYIFSQLLERGWFPEMEGYLRARLAGALFRAGRDRLYFNHIKEARSYFKKAFLVRPDWRPAIGGLLCFFPRTVRKHLRLSGDFLV